MTKSKLIRHIEKYTYVSFDLYDTLIFRTVDQPSDIFFLVQEIYNNTTPNNIVYFKERRIIAEKIARKIHDDGEVTLDDIYEKLFINVKHKSNLKQLEQDIEISVSVPNQEMIEILDFCRENGKKIVITTDMYLPIETIEEILKKNKISYDYLFLSSMVGVTKYSGRLFPYILEKLTIDADDIVHLGDNPFSDIEQAKSVGIDSILRIKKTQEFNRHVSKKSGDVFSNHIYNYLQYVMPYKPTDVQYELGYAVLGPLLFELSEYIESIRKTEDIEKVMFVAREGFLLKKAYDILHSDQNSYYIRINKNLLRYPSLYVDSSVETFINTIPNKHSYSWNTLLSYFPGIDFEKYDLNMELSRKDLLTGKHSIEFEEIFSKYRSQFKEQFELFRLYAIQNGINNGRILLVNNSINGNGQYMLSTLCDRVGIQNDTIGLQMARSSKCRKKLGNKVRAYFEDIKMPKYYSSMFDYCTLLFEHLMFENSGTAIKFLDTNPVTVECEPIGSESNNSKTLNRIQEAALDFVNDYKNCALPIGERAIYLFFDLFLRPTREEAEIIGNIIDVEADTAEPLIKRMKWKQAEMVKKDQDVNKYNNKLVVKSMVKYILDRLHLLDYLIS